ncbi:unnamed protein product, partial [marine sediment metagenome]
MYGWRGRIGLIVPSVNTVIEPEFYKMMPEGIGVYTSRVKNAKTTSEDLVKMNASVARAAEELSTANVDVIAYGCTTGSLVKGIQWEKDLCRRIEGLTDIPAITTSGAVIQALKAMGISRLAVVTPYPEELNILEKKFLEQNNIEVLNMRGLGIMEAVEIGEKSPGFVYRLAKNIFVPEAKGIFISCTNLRTVEIIEKLENDIGRPVIT